MAFPSLTDLLTVEFQAVCFNSSIAWIVPTTKSSYTYIAAFSAMVGCPMSVNIGMEIRIINAIAKLQELGFLRKTSTITAYAKMALCPKVALTLAIKAKTANSGYWV